MRIGRRRLLQGIGASLASVPFLQSIPSSAGETGFPKRLLFFYSPNDNGYPDMWMPAGEGSEFALPESLPAMLQPLEDYRDNLLIIGNMAMHTRDKETGPGGHVGMGHQLTGWANIPWENQESESEFWAGGISIDQFIANELGVDALCVSSKPYGNNGGCRISYRGANDVVHPYEDPVAAFNTLFGDPDLGDDELIAQYQRQVRSLDRVAVELDRLRGRVPSVDRDKIDAHLEHLLRLQSDLQSFTPATCDPAAPEGGFDYGSSLDYPITSRRQMDILAQAVACGVTRVGSIQNGNTGNAESYAGTLDWPSEGIFFDRSQHVVSHDYEVDPNNPVFAEDRLILERFYVSQYAYLLEKLRGIPEGDGTVLDNTLVVWTKGMGSGHNKTDLLYLLAGGRGFPEIDFGRYIDRENEPHNNLLVTIANLMGVEIDTFGDPEICTGALPL
jgi:hypothetical protein